MKLLIHIKTIKKIYVVLGGKLINNFPNLFLHTIFLQMKIMLIEYTIVYNFFKLTRFAWYGKIDVNVQVHTPKLMIIDTITIKIKLYIHP